jgi:membrane-associated protease RseP (regulator of RpoE activity)
MGVSKMQRGLWLPLLVLALGLAAIGGFVAAAWTLSEGGGAEGGPSAVVTQAPEKGGESGEGQLEPTPTPGEGNQPGYLGVVLADSRSGEGVLVVRVASRSPAARAGFEADDVITAVDGKRVNDSQEVVDAVTNAGPGAELTFTIKRGGDERELRATLTERPPNLGEPMPRILPQTPNNGRLQELWPFPGGLGASGALGLGSLFDGSGRLLQRFVRAELVYLNDEGKTETVRAVAGAVKDVSKDELVLTPKDGGPDERFRVSDETGVWQLLQRGELGDIKKGDDVVVVARDGNQAAAIIDLESVLSGVPS